jgi:phenylalanine-4-hydroxylase
MQPIEKIPDHLQPYIAEQDPSLYTAMDHAGWRYILRVSKAFFKENAHPKYLAGLEETGISTERIPLISEMDARLRRFGWRAVGVSGFIPPAVFMEFQSLGILPIACDMRQMDHLAYTPAPDIVHEAAGHAPIIADPEYSAYLRAYGQVARKAIFSSKDMAVYEAIRHLSDTKEDPQSTPTQIAEAQTRLERAVADVDYVSEATLLARMNWWTVEYGLVGDPKRPLIYGAGLLSSVGESFNCLKDQVRKLPLTLDCVNVSYDITRPQPQLFVAADFPTLTRQLEEFAELMAFKRGGAEGLTKAKMAATVTTAELDSGVQISGVLKDFLLDARGAPAYLQYVGPTQLAYEDLELPGQGPRHHSEGFGTPVGKLAGTGKSPADLSENELRTLSELKFESGVVVQGKFAKRIDVRGRGLVLTYTDCTVTWGEETLFRPEWGTFDLACGVRVTSVFGNAADRGAYLAYQNEIGNRPEPPGRPKTNLNASNRGLDTLYARVRSAREQGKSAVDQVAQALTETLKSHPGDWLLPLEVLELEKTWSLPIAGSAAARERLASLRKSSPVLEDLIRRGLELIQ